MKSVDLAILNYRGRKHLEHLLPTALAEAEHYAGACRVVVVDNQSGAEEEAWVRERFPQVVFWTAPRNDFLFSYNEFAADTEAEIVVLLNNDLKLKRGFIAPLVRHFALDDVFAVGATSRDWEDQEYTCGPARLTKAHGSYRWGYDCGSQMLQHTLFTSGGFMAVDRAKFLELGGFDRLYHPAYCEDLDLCFRAWRRGWRCIFEPASVALHRETGSWDQAGREKVNRILLRNSLLFEWRSLPMGSEKVARLWSRLKVAAGTLRQGDWRWTKIFLVTWLESALLRRKYNWSPATADELDVMVNRVKESVAGSPVGTSVLEQPH